MRKQKPVGVVGLGRMGGPLARRLAQQELSVLAWDVAKPSRDALANDQRIRIAPLADIARECEIVFFVVPS